MYACLYILEIWNVKLYDYPELILIFHRLVTFKNLLNTLPSHVVENTGIMHNDPFEVTDYATNCIFVLKRKVDIWSISYDISIHQ